VCKALRKGVVQLSDLEAVPASESTESNYSQDGEALGISINTAGIPGELVAYGLVSRSAQSGLDLGSIEFIDPAPLRSPVPVVYS
jgi:hypothetical protein